MIYYFVVTWCLAVWGGPSPSADKYGRSSGISCAVYLHTGDDCAHRRMFHDRDSAIAFYDDAKAQENMGTNGAIENVKIDSVK